MSTVVSSTEPALRLPEGRWDEVRRSLSDLGPLLRFRAASLRGRSRRVAVLGLGVIGILTVAAAWLPAYLPDTWTTEVFSLLPSALVGVLLIAVISAAASAGGRELVPRDEAVAYPISPTTDHLGALLMAPLNIAWLLQSWLLLGATAYVLSPRWGLVLSQIVVLIWLVAATALAQVAGWGIEWLRRGPYGVWAVRGLTALIATGGAVIVASGLLGSLLNKSPTIHVTIASLQAAEGPNWRTVATTVALLLVTFLAVAVGAWLAAAVAARPARDELRLESSSHVARPHPQSDLAALVRTDRVGIWRSVPLRRGLLVLALMPGVVAIAGGLQWEMLTILPGLVASGGALLFGVNSWSLDGRGALWRDSLPVDPRLVLTSRMLVLVEVLAVATLGTILLASLRAGLPDAAELSAVLCAAVVVIVQVVSASLRWSVHRPFSVDLRSARATPAPPLVMVGYSARLALSTTMVGLFFSLLARLSWEWPVLFAVPMLLFSAFRLARTASAWADPVTRSRVIATVSG